MVRGKTREDLDTDRKLTLALIRLLEIIGEAASRIPKEDQEKYISIPWPEIISLRNRLINGYDRVDLDILWEIVSVDLPLLVPNLHEAIDFFRP